MDRRVIIATENLGKVNEIKRMLADEFDRFYSLKDFKERVEIIEDSQFYIENALKKARKIGNRFGYNTIADDSGLEVDALNGRPGVYSSRYGKDDNERIEKLLAELKEVPWEKRTARFVAYVIFYMPDKGSFYVFYGQLDGYIGFERKGAHGFGFDPVFYIPEYDRYLAEIELDEKNKISHRGKAVLALKSFLNADFFKRPPMRHSFQKNKDL
ncbi:MAG TPA: RdgB/HAM1 family non-canonical purine NTP pyrophosphatase [Syntrophorhabdaceae bacterium]|nr:RdgB/HAM1 family non-canonical purine NTP pyrophosphatase [Syntrophorhabdaceae bacterium]HOL06096.1 RdgB/HAM1 family non-canonical purine NTP pyrophosphatase [Syntrophorhabdaceae bacterium]HON85913.1 RdgB/HAM1 family non-canonical purine NTP pyrophosphatase [Syntrophorhabdaceae bacterium]HOT42320.1 RdgB/HAM1 family non-canonical purine NTP pyrophosphatase [Syntrophorhabdaceae bacterium]HPC67440.1 RdgB/HAM1 family non-canonical purine NTP pyrophosphatase [Syntrophorhabdaceae bacterium]